MNWLKQSTNFLGRAACFVFWVTSVVAQDAAPLPAVEFSCVSWEKIDKDQKLYYRDGSNYELLEIGYKRRSKLQELSAGHTHLEIYDKIITPDGEVDFRAVGRGANVPRTDRVLFFVQLVTDAQQGVRAGVFGINDSLSAFPVGSFRFFNTTNEPLQVLINESKGDLPPRELSNIQPEIPELGGFLPVYIGDSESNVLYQSRFFSQPRGRKLVIIQPPEEPDGRIRMRFLSEIVRERPVEGQ